MRFRCVNGICVLQRLEARRKIGVIELPDSAINKSETARVLERCPKWIEDGKERESTLNAGDIVCISKYSGQEFEINGSDMKLNIVLVRERDILCILDDFNGVNLGSIPPKQALPENAQASVWGDGIAAEPQVVPA